MCKWTALRNVAVVVLALHCTHALTRLHKRNGFTYKIASLPAHHLLYETSSYASHEPASAPAHESSSGSNKYETTYYEFKHPGSGATSSSHSHSGSNSNSNSGSSHPKPGYSIGSGLRSIAQGSANQAYTAVASQHAAAKQAAFIAKNTLAQAATQAAATAQAALTGKQVLLQELEQQAAEAQRGLSRELEQLKSAKIAANLAQQTSHAAYNHVSVLTAAVNNAKSVAEQAEQASKEVDNQLASQSAMVGQAKNRLEQVEEQLKQARVDFAATKEAAIKASSSAAEAQVNASKAAAHATIGLHESTNHQPSHDGEESYDEHIETTGNGHSELEIDRHA